MPIRRSTRLENKETVAIYKDDSDDEEHEPTIKSQHRTTKSIKKTKSIALEDGSDEFILTPPTPAARCWG